MIACKRVVGEMVYNDGEFAEIETYGVEICEENMFLTTFQLHIEDTSDTPAQFQKRFPSGTWLNALTKTVITPFRSRLAER